MPTPLCFYLNGHKAFKTANLQPVGLSADTITPFFSVSAAAQDAYLVTCYVKINGQPVEISRNECSSSVVFFYNNNLYLWNKPEDIGLAEKFTGKGDKNIISKEDWPARLKDLILPLTKDYHVDFDPGLVKEVKDGDPERKLYYCRKRGTTLCSSLHLLL